MRQIQLLLVSLLFTVYSASAANPVADTLNLPRTVFSEKSGIIQLTAEDGMAVGPDISYMPEWKAFGWFTATARVEWYVVLGKAGTYDVFLEWSVSDEESGKAFVIEFGSQKLTGKVAKSGSWETFKTAKIGSLTLKEGSHRVVFRPSTDFGKGAILDLRKITLKPTMQ